MKHAKLDPGSSAPWPRGLTGPRITPTPDVYQCPVFCRPSSLLPIIHATQGSASQRCMSTIVWRTTGYQPQGAAAALCVGGPPRVSKGFQLGKSSDLGEAHRSLCSAQALPGSMQLGTRCCIALCAVASALLFRINVAAGQLNLAPGQHVCLPLFNSTKADKGEALVCLKLSVFDRRLGGNNI